MVKKLLLGFALVYTMFCFSCRKTPSRRTLSLSAGRSADVILICPRSIWNELEQSVRDLTNKPFMGLPQIESSCNLIYIEPSQFTQIFQSSHSIIRLIKDTINQIKFAKDIWAQPQSVITISGKNTQDIARLFRKNFDSLYVKLHDFHISRLQLLQSKQPILKSLDRLSRMIDQEKRKVFVPNTFHLAIDRDDFLWYRSDVSKGSQNLVFYRFSIPDQLPAYLDDWLLHQRDRYLMQIEGQLPNSYMKTERAYLPYFHHQILSDDRLLVEVKGIWKLERDFMGGPFLSYFLIDYLKKEVLAFEGFVYLPSQKKRDNMLYLEALLKKNIY